MATEVCKDPNVTNSELPKAMYRGVLPIGEVPLKCVVLDNEMRVLPAISVFKAFGKKRRGNRDRDPFITVEGVRIQLPPFVAGSNLIPFMDNDLKGWIQRLEFMDGDNLDEGYDANIIPAMCKLFLSARRAGVLTLQQEPTAVIAEILYDSFARVGIVALIDEATGYQHSRNKDALKFLLEQYVAEGMQQWVKTFPDSFFAQLDKLYDNPKTTSRKRPQYYGKFINKYIYDPIENGYVKDYLDSKNIKDDGTRKVRFHQWLTEFGKNMLLMQIGRVMGKMEECQSIGQFKRRIKKQDQLTIAPSLFENIEEWDELGKGE